ncbi:MAG: hypothetical protein M3297_08030 [Thermoproteota archaeon]|jgi:hypothetical protein|nr:hypothetical protein [Thermoproteota archaeon]
MSNAKQEMEKKEIPVNIPSHTVNSMKKEFGLADSDVSIFVTSLIEKKIADHISEVNSKVFSESETKEIEDDLKGLGYI